MNLDFEYPDYYTIPQFAARANLSTKTVRNYIRSGRIKAKRLGVKLIVIPIEELDKLYTTYVPKRRQR